MTTLQQEAGSLEIGSQAIWSVSSCKLGNGVSQLRDNSHETYWQSDGTQPHQINIEFLQKTAVKRIAIYADYKLDESYTPNKIAIRAGTNFHNLQQITVLDIEEPDQEWVDMDIKNKDGTPVKAFLFQICILSNHQNGRDTHVRQVKVFALDTPTASSELVAAGCTGSFESVEFTSMLTCR